MSANRREKMTNIFKMMKDAAAAQQNLKKIQDDLKRKTVEVAAGGGRIRVTARGDASILGIKLDPALLSSGRCEEIENLLLKAVNEALEKVKKETAEHMQNMMAKMGLPDIPGI